MYNGLVAAFDPLICIFRYEDSPTCENNCGGSNLLYCNEMKNMCLPIRRIGSAALVKAFPLPGSGRSASDPILKLRVRFNPYPDDKILDQARLKSFADDKLNVTKIIISVFDRVENILGKGEIACTSNFSFSHNVFKRRLTQTCQKVS